MKIRRKTLLITLLLPTAIIAGVFVVRQFTKADYLDEPIQAVWVSPDGSSAILEVWTGHCNDDGRVRLREADDTVTITVALREWEGTCNAVAVISTIKVKFDSPVIGKRLVDASDDLLNRVTEPPRGRPFPVKIQHL